MDAEMDNLLARALSGMKLLPKTVQNMESGTLLNGDGIFNGIDGAIDDPYSLLRRQQSLLNQGSE